MNDEIYKQIVELIKRHSPWINVISNDSTLEFNYITNDNICSSLVKCITLSVKKSVGKYHKGLQWKIPFHVINQSIQNLSKKDKSFEIRVKQKNITKYDVEKIILESSYGIIHLYLYNYGVFSNYGSFSGTI